MRQFIAFPEALYTNPLFAGIPASRVDSLIGMAPEQAAYGRGDIIFSPERYERKLAILLSGSALVYRTGGEGHRILMSRLTAGEAFGMASLFYEQAAYPTAIHAEKSCTVLFLDKAWLEEVFAAEPRLAANYITILSERIHFLGKRLDTLAGDEPHIRVMKVLHSLRTEQASDTIALPYSLSQLAEHLGIGRASLYRALDALEAEGTIRREGKTIHIIKEELP